MEPARQSKLGAFSRSLRSSLIPDFMTTLMVPLSCGLFNCSVSVDWYMITSMPGACPKDVQRRQEGFLSALPEVVVCTDAVQILVGLKRLFLGKMTPEEFRLPERGTLSSNGAEPTIGGRGGIGWSYQCRTGSSIELR